MQKRTLAVSAILVSIVAVQAYVHAGQQQTTKSRIQGVVVSATTNEPVPGAKIIRLALPGDPVSQAPQTYAADANGRYTIPDLDAGVYAFSFSSPGYVEQFFGAQVAMVASSPPIVVTASEARNLTVRLTPMGTISGRIVDTNHRPLAGIAVQILQPIYDGTRRNVLRVAGEARTDDHGDYRAFRIAPGRFYAMAGISSPVPSAVRSNNSSPNEVPGDGVAAAFYPGVAERSQAMLVELKAGGETGGIDFVLQRLHSHRIRGRVVDAATGKPPKSASVALANIPLDGDGFGFTSNGRNYNAEDGTIDLRDVPPGPHFVFVEMADPDLAPLPRVASAFPWSGGGGGGGGGTMSRGRILASVLIPVNITDSDIDDLVITLSPPLAIHGRLTEDGSITADSVSGMRVQLWPWVNGSIALSPPGPAAVPVQADGTFTIEGASSGDYRVAVGSGDPNAYIREARFGASDALDKPMTVSVSESAILSIVVSVRSAQLDGTIVDPNLQPASGLRAVLIPDQHRDRVDLYRNVVSDVSGRFHMQGIPPGDYKLFAWTSLEPYSYYDPDFLQKYEGHGRPVHLLESSRTDVQVRLIP